MPNSGRNEDCGRGTGEENVELNNVFVPKEYNPEWNTMEELNVAVECAGASVWDITPCWQCLVMMRYDHDGGGEKEIKDFKAADDVKEVGTAEGLEWSEWTGVVVREEERQ